MRAMNLEWHDSTSATTCICAVSAFLGMSSRRVLYRDAFDAQQGDFWARPVLRFQNRHGPRMSCGMGLYLHAPITRTQVLSPDKPGCCMHMLICFVVLLHPSTNQFPAARLQLLSCLTTGTDTRACRSVDLTAIDLPPTVL